MPRTDGELPTTVPASPGALFVAGLLREAGPTQCETDAEFTIGSLMVVRKLLTMILAPLLKLIRSHSESRSCCDAESHR